MFKSIKYQLQISSLLYLQLHVHHLGWAIMGPLYDFQMFQWIERCIYQLLIKYWNFLTLQSTLTISFLCSTRCLQSFCLNRDLPPVWFPVSTFLPPITREWFRGKIQAISIHVMVRSQKALGQWTCLCWSITIFFQLK